jgi:hypothetical protein
VDAWRIVGALLALDWRMLYWRCAGPAVEGYLALTPSATNSSSAQKQLNTRSRLGRPRSEVEAPEQAGAFCCYHAPAMQSPDSRPGRWVPFDQARMILRMSEGTLRRAIKDGTVVAEQRRRNPESTTDLRMVYEVLVSDAPASASLTESASASDPPAATTRLLGMLSERDETIRDQSARIASLEREAGRLEGQVIAANAERDAARQAAEAARTALERERRRSWWDRLIGRYPD